ncbi:unnamed protein product [Calicophoron daubneyi]|uniref:Coiled-coil domain-containing protein 102A n=1 Tax=Calicophoron daubneyi TaxID=300641 RepID=A0AAV2TJI5_CALDB
MQMWQISRPPGPPVINGQPLVSAPNERVMSTRLCPNAPIRNSEVRARGNALAANIRPSSSEVKHRDKELEEARLRTVQLEKTMRWWSDCTASWREKWALVRDERNQLRDELRSTRKALESANRSIKQLEVERSRLLSSGFDSSGQHWMPSASATAWTTGVVTKSGKYRAKSSPLESATFGRDYNRSPSCSDAARTPEKPLYSTEHPTNPPLCADSTSLIQWWKDQCDFLGEELRRMLAVNTKQWSTCERLAHENRLLKLENSRMKREISGENSLPSISGKTSNEKLTSASPVPADHQLPVSSQNSEEHEQYEPGSSDTPLFSHDGNHVLSPTEEHCAQLEHLQRRISALIQERNQLYDRLETAIAQRGQLELQDEPGEMRPIQTKTFRLMEPEIIQSTTSADCASTASELAADETCYDSEPSELLIQVATESSIMGAEPDETIESELLRLGNDINGGNPDENDGTLRMAVSTLDRPAEASIDGVSESWHSDEKQSSPCP